MKELMDRRNMALRVFRPMSHQEPLFQMPRAKYMAVDGGNRAGKTLSIAALIGSICTGIPITLEDGSEIEQRMPWQKNRPLRIWLVCIDSRHIGNTLYPMLFKSGAFKIAFDKTTKLPRAYRPDSDPDEGISSKDARPFIPGKFISNISWESKNDQIFKKIELTDPSTGKELAEIHAYTSKSDPPQGVPVDLIWVDEQIQRAKFIDEMKARLVDREGQLIWSSWADEDNEELAKFNGMIDREIEAQSDVARRVTLTMSENKHLSRKSISDFLAGCATEEERLQRDKGIAPSEKLRMYPLFDREFHSAYGRDEAEDDALAKILRKRDGIPPNDWTKTLILDPGTQHPAVLLCAVPPPEYGKYFVPYQEFYPGRLDATQIASLLKRETHGQKFLQFICDRRAGRQTAMGDSQRIVDKYADAFRDVGLRSARTKSNFHFASDNVGARQMELQKWMHPIKETGLPTLRIVTHRCPELCTQLRKIKKAKINKEVRDDRKVAGQASDIVDCLEYWSASNPKYILVKPDVEDGTPGFQRYMKKFGTKKKGREPIRMGTYY